MSETRTPFLDAAARWRISLGALVSIIATAIAGATAFTLLRADVQMGKSDLAAHEVQLRGVDTRVRVLEAGQAEIAAMKTDIQWIRRELERNRADRQ